MRTKLDDLLSEFELKGLGKQECINILIEAYDVYKYDCRIEEKKVDLLSNQFLNRYCRPIFNSYLKHMKPKI